MASVATWFGFICWALPSTVSTTPGGLPTTRLTGCFSFQVMLDPAGTMPWYICTPAAFVSPTQQSWFAVSLMTATGGPGCAAATGATVGATVGLGFAAGRSVDVWAAD